jgi:hypothetical protein
MGIDNDNSYSRNKNTISISATIWVFADTGRVRKRSIFPTTKTISSLLEEIFSMIPYSRSRRNIPEYPEIAENIYIKLYSKFTMRLRYRKMP